MASFYIFKRLNGDYVLTYTLGSWREETLCLFKTLDELQNFVSGLLKEIK